MKLKTSFFNLTVLKKDITRFAPVWGLYTVLSLMFVMLIWEGEGSAARFMSNAPNILQGMGMLNLCYGGLCAVLLFGDLFNSKLCNALHAMPMRREGWFLTHLAAGLLFCIVPNLVSALVAAALLQQYAYGAFLWLAVMVLQYLFFFGVGAFAALCAGNKLGAVAAYSIINFFAFIATWLAVTFYEPLLYGVSFDAEAMITHSPLWRFAQSGYLNVSYDNMTEVTVFEGFLTEDWQYLYVAAAVGLALAALALLLYRRRQLESAGDLIAFKSAAPVFLAIYTLCVGAAMYSVAELAAEALRYLFLLLGLAIGFFTGRMLLERKVHVFRGKNFLAFGILVAVFAGSLGLTWLDPAGITRYVPEPSRVRQVYISPYGSDYYRQKNGVPLQNPEDIAAITQVHSQVLQTRLSNSAYPLWIRYELEDGSVLEREYYLEEGKAAVDIMGKYYSTPEYVFGTDDLDALLDIALSVEFQSYYKELPSVGVGISGQWLDMDSFREKFGYDTQVLTHLTQGSLREDATVKGLTDAVIADCKAGTMVQEWNYHNDSTQHHDSLGHLLIHYGQSGYYYDTVEIVIYEDAINTINYLKGLIAQ